MKHKRLRRSMFALGSAALLVGVSACSSSDNGDGAEVADVSFEEGTTMAELNSDGKITVGTKYDQPGFGLLNPGTQQPEGFDVEIAKIIAGQLGISSGDIEWVEAVSANREPFIEQDKVDIVVATYTINDERKEVVDFAGPYYQAGQDLMVAKGNPLDISGPDDMADKNICSVEGSTPAQNVRQNYKDAKLTLFDVYSKCAEALKNGQVDAVTTDNVILLGLVAGEPDEFELVDNPFTEEPYGIGLKKDDSQFRDWINDTIEQAYEDGSWADAWEETAGEFADTPEPIAVDRYSSN